MAPIPRTISDCRLEGLSAQAGHLHGDLAGSREQLRSYVPIAVAKHQDHLPLNRLESIIKRYGFKLPLQEDVLHADETSVKLRLEAKKGSKDSWVFGWRNLREHDQPKALVEFRMGRGRDGPTRLLGEWSGTLITDGYAGYNQICEKNGIRRAGCWAHARRKFKEALDTGSKDAAWPLFLIGRACGGAPSGARGHGARRARVPSRGSASTPLACSCGAHPRSRLDLFEKRSTLPKSKPGKAVKYLANQRVYLDAYLEDARIPMHNSDSERDMRPSK